MPLLVVLVVLTVATFAMLIVMRDCGIATVKTTTVVKVWALALIGLAALRIASVLLSRLA